MIKKAPIKIQSSEIQKQRREIAMMKFAKDILSAHQQLIAKLDEAKRLIAESKNAPILSPFKREDIVPKKGWDYFTPAEIQSIIDYVVERIPPPEQGAPGKKGDKGDPGKAGYTPRRGVDYFTPQDVDIIIAEVLSLIPPSKPGEPGTPGKNAVIDYEEIVKNLVDGKYLKTNHIDGLEQKLTSMWNQIGKKGYLHGGGDTVKAGTNITITRNSDGTTTITSTGGVGAWSTPPETPAANGSVTAFTVGTTAPTDVVADGTSYYSGQGYTHSVITGKITFNIGGGGPTQFVRFR